MNVTSHEDFSQSGEVLRSQHTEVHEAGGEEKTSKTSAFKARLEKLTPKCLETAQESYKEHLEGSHTLRQTISSIKFLLILNFPEVTLAKNFIKAVKQKDEPGTRLEDSKLAAISSELLTGLVFAGNALAYHAVIGIATPLFFVPLSIGKIVYEKIARSEHDENLRELKKQEFMLPD